jgi:hypothetical protein
MDVGTKHRKKMVFSKANLRVAEGTKPRTIQTQRHPVPHVSSVLEVLVLRWQTVKEGSKRQTSLHLI